MTFPVHEVIFFAFAAIVVFAALMVITARNPVHSVLFLVLAFVGSSVLWMLMQAEFLSLVLIFVYVGAVMTLFLFVVMMINIDLAVMREKFVRFLPVAMIVTLAFVIMLLWVLNPRHFSIAHTLPVHYAATYSNVRVMGMALYTDYVLPFELAAVILLVAIIAAISLAFHGRKPNTKVQDIAAQHAVSKRDRLKIISIEAEKK